MIQSDTIQLYQFVSYFLFLDFFLFSNSKNRKIENIIQSDTIELYHVVSYFYFKILFQKVFIQVLRKLKVLC